jgi:TonB-dependent receptor
MERAMRINTFRLNLLLASALMTAPQALAQETEDSEARMQTVVVSATPILDSQIAAITEKRNADNLVDVAAADTVGRFPDQNAAAALARLPAIAVQRDQGQERYIQIRGAPNRWVAVSIDGVPVIGVDEGGATRAFRFDAIPAVLLSSAAVSKSLTADLSAEAVVANVDLRTYSALDNPGLKLQGDVGYGEMELGGGKQEQYSLRASWTNDRIGILIGGSHYLREQVTDNREVGAYNGPIPTEFDIRNYQLERANDSYFGGIELQATDQLRVFAKAIYTEFTDNEERDQYEFRIANTTFGTRGLQGGNLARVPVRGTFNSGDYLTAYDIYSLGADYEGDAWDISGRLNFTGSENTTFLPLIQVNTSSAQAPSLVYDTTDPNFPIISLFTTVPGPTPGSFVAGTPLAGLDQAAFASAIYIPVLQDSFSDSYTGKLDATRRFDRFELSGGLSYTERELDGFTFAASNAVVLNSALPAIGQTFAIGNYVSSSPWNTNFPLGFSFNEIDNVALRNDVLGFVAQLQAAGLYNPANDVPPENRYALTEETIAGYIQGKMEFDRAQIVAGLRVENFSTDNSGTARLAGNILQPLSVSDEYTELFPSLNLKYDINDSIVFRIAGQRSLARPSFGEIRVGSSINDTTSPGTISGGNPSLEPEDIWGIDTSLEFYITPSSLFAISGFHRWVDGVLFSNTQPVGTDDFNTGGVDRSGYRLSSTFNGGEGYLTGIELNIQQQFEFLPGALDGLGFQGNLTLLDGGFDSPGREDAPLPGTSETIVNASLFYEKFGFSGRVSYQWRDDWLDTLGGLGTGSSGDEYRKGYENLDVALRYAINDNFTLYADLANLTDATYIAYSGVQSQPSEVEQIGSRYLFGLRFSY